MSNTISANQVDERLDELFVLDIRPKYRFDEGHIDGSTTLPMYDQLQGRNFIGLDASLSTLPDDREIVVVCYSGVTAAIAADYLQQHGFHARALAGGMDAWESRPVEAESPGATV